MSAVQNPGAEPQQPAATTLAQSRVPHEPGAPIGNYRLMEKIGEGGFGLVFVAEQQRPVKRKVALKVIKPGMDTREVIARFEAERQALALMDHPNIARVLDAGTTDSGHPYFVMELVRGIAMTDYCDQARLTLRERLQLFVNVCQAIEHAHQKGIIHRDIKPSNVLVTLHDGLPVVKVIDFGVAKALHQQLTDKTIYTRFAQVIGTPLYMSPEQAEMSGLDIDTRSDIYSLGVLLYQLLTGTTPFDGKRLAQAAFDERIRIIRQEEPPKPSTRLRQSTDTLPAIAAQRRVEPARLSKMFRGDLDWITMKAMDKDRTRRYQTAGGLAADVVRYLRDEPVEASPPSTTYLLRKFARRYRGILAIGLAFMGLLLAGIVASTWFALQEKSAREFAESESRRANQNAESARTETEKAQKAQAETETARRAESEQRKAAQQALERSERSLYLSGIALAERNWQANNPKRVADNLELCPPRFRGWEWFYLDRLVHAELMTYRGDHAAYSPDGELLATSDKDQAAAVQIRSARTGEILMNLQGGHPIPLLASLVFSPDSRRLAAICQESAIWIWDLSNGRQPLRVPVRLNDETLKYALNSAVGLAFSPDGNRIALAGVPAERSNKNNGLPSDNLVIWDAFTGKELLKVANTGRSVAFSPDGTHLAISSRDFMKVGAAIVGPFTQGMRILNANGGAVITQFPAWRMGTRNDVDDCLITYSPNGKWLASVRDQDIKIWDATTAKELRTLVGHSRRVTDLCFIADGKKLVSCSLDETVRIWDLERGEAPVVCRGHVGAVTSIAFHPDAKRVVSTGEDRTVRVWSATNQQGPRSIPGTEVHWGSIGVSPDGKQIACLKRMGEVGPRKDGQYDLVLVDAITARQILVLHRFVLPEDDPVHASLIFSPDGRLLASALAKEVQVWDVATGKEVAHLPGLCDIRRRGLAFSLDGGRLAFPNAENDIEVWDIRPDKLHKRLSAFSGHKGPVTTISFSPHGERVASGSTDGTVQVWNPVDGKKISELKGTPEVLAGVVFSPDGRYLLASSPDMSVRIWDLEKGAELPPLRGHKSSVWSIAFNPNGTRLATVGMDGSARLWTWPQREEILTIAFPSQSPPEHIGFTADGRHLFAAGNSGATDWDATARPTAGDSQK